MIRTTIQPVQPLHPQKPSSETNESGSVDLNDFDRILRNNLIRVFGERVRDKRRQAIAEIYAQDAVLYEPHGEARGHAAIDNAVQTLLDMLPPSFVFTANGTGSGHHGLGRMRWTSGPANGTVVATGTDIVQVSDGLIQTLHVILDPPDSL